MTYGPPIPYMEQVYDGPPLPYMEQVLYCPSHMYNLMVPITLYGTDIVWSPTCMIWFFRPASKESTVCPNYLTSLSALWLIHVFIFQPFCSYLTSTYSLLTMKYLIYVYCFSLKLNCYILAINGIWFFSYTNQIHVSLLDPTHIWFFYSMNRLWWSAI